MIESDSFRRDLGERLTEAVVKEIELKTPYKVVGTPDADSVLAARLVGDTKRVIVENQNDDPRASKLRPVRRGHLVQPPPRAAGAAERRFRCRRSFVPIARRRRCCPKRASRSPAQQQQAIQRLAEQIVATMEEPW